MSHNPDMHIDRERLDPTKHMAVSAIEGDRNAVPGCVLCRLREALQDKDEATRLLEIKQTRLYDLEDLLRASARAREALADRNTLLKETLNRLRRALGELSRVRDHLIAGAVEQDRQLLEIRTQCSVLEERLASRYEGEIFGYVPPSDWPDMAWKVLLDRELDGDTLDDPHYVLFRVPAEKVGFSTGAISHERLEAALRRVQETQ